MTETSRRVVEVKRWLDGREHRFECDLIEWSATRVIVRFKLERLPASLAVEGLSGPLDSYGFFWRRRPYNCYCFLPTGAPISSRPVLVRFDVARSIEFLEPPDGLREVRWVDLILDLVVNAQSHRWEDEEELAEARRAGAVSDSDLALVERARRTLEVGHRRVIAEARRTLAGFRPG